VAVTIHDLIPDAPEVLRELSAEYLRAAEIATTADPRSQRSACLLLALRSASILHGISQVLSPEAVDSADLLARGFLEARDLLLTFRFDDEGTRRKIYAWFEGKGDGAWKPNHQRCEDYIRSMGGGESELEIRWSMQSALSHSTYVAATNSSRVVERRIKGPEAPSSIAYDVKVADYLLAFASLFALTAGEQPTWISLSLDPARMNRSILFSLMAAKVSEPILDATRDNRLPGDRYKPQPR
jgi:hypothetical protein